MSKITDKILNAPCIFCNYTAPRYWDAKSHKSNCPFYNVSGKINRKKAFKAAVQKQSILLGGFQGVKTEAAQ